MADYRYSVFGLDLHSDIEFPELFSSSLSGNSAASVSVCHDSAVLPPVSGGEAISSSFIFSVDGVARFSVYRGKEIAVDPSWDTDAESIRLFLLSTGLGVLLQQRLVPVLHGSSIVTPNGAIVFAGPSGSGKSTLAAVFSLRGFPVLTDEIAAVNLSGGNSVLPGPAALMLWNDVLQRLSIDPARLTRARPELQKFLLPLGASYSPQPVPLRKVYILENSNRIGYSLIPLRGTARFKALAANLYRPALAIGMGLEMELALRIAELASETEIVRLIRPKGLFDTDKLSEMLESDFS